MRTLKIKTNKNFYKWFFSVLLFFVVFGASLISMIGVGHAQQISAPINDFSLDEDVNGTWSISDDKSTITGKVESDSSTSCGNTTYTAVTTTLTIGNINETYPGIFKCDWELKDNSNNNQLSLGGTSQENKEGSITQTIKSGEVFEIKLTSNSDNTSAVTVTLSNCSFELEIPEEQWTTTFYPAEGGSYQVKSADGTTIDIDSTSGNSITQSSNDVYTISVSIESDYKLVGWYINNIFTNSYSTTGTSYEFAYTATSNNLTLRPRFVEKNLATFQVDSNTYYSLEEATAAATNASKKVITVVSDGYVPAGNYTIPSGVTLLIPFDSAGTVFRVPDKDTHYITGYSSPSLYRKLILESGANIDVSDGAEISVSAKRTAQGGKNGCITGTYGLIEMKENSSITLNSNSKLYCWGLISGDGIIHAKSDSTVYEGFQITGWRGGTATSTLISDKEAFPISQYYVQNIECNLRLYYGSTEIVSTAIFVTLPVIGEIKSDASLTFIGKTDGLFKITGDNSLDGESGYLNKYYDVSKDKTIFSINHLKTEISSINFSISSYGIDSSKYILPLHDGLKINLNSGSETVVNSSQRLSLLPGFELDINEGAKLTAKSDVYIYDYEDANAENGIYTDGYLHKTVPYISTGKKPSVRPNPKTTPISDATVLVNGILTIEKNAYTTENGANVYCTNGKGEITFTNACSNTTSTIKHAIQNNTAIEYGQTIVSSIKLHNYNISTENTPTHTITAGSAAGSVFKFCIEENCGPVWYCSQFYTIALHGSDSKTIEIDISEIDSNYSGGHTYYTLPSFPKEFEKEGYRFLYWTIGTSTEPYYPGDKIHISGDTNVYAYMLVNIYKVTWNVEGVLTIEEYSHGEAPNYKKEPPTKDGNNYFSYSFEGWSTTKNGVILDPLPVAISDATYYAVFKQVTNKYKVTWLNYDGSALGEDEFEYNSKPSYDGENPVGPSNTAEFSYNFVGWSTTKGGEKLETLPVVTGAVTYYAVFEEVKNKYKVTFYDENGTTVLKSSDVEYGTMPTAPADPSKAEDAQYTYTFAGWSPAISTVTGEATYTATYSSTLRTYTVTWVDEDGTELEKDENVPYGTDPSYNGSTPVKEEDAQYTYTFSGWTPTIGKVTGNVTYKATYSSTTNSYTVTWVDGNGETLDTQTYKYGTTPVYSGETPTKTATAQYTYTFNSTWSPSIEPVKGDITYTAQFDSTVNSYTVKFVDEDGTEIHSSLVAYGTVPTKPADPTKEATAEFTYTFAGWDPEVVAVTGDATYTATYTATKNKYTITFVNEDGTELQSSKVEYGELPKYEGETPTKAATAQYTYTFKGWDKEIVAVVGNATYTAQFDSTVNEYTITWKNYDGTVLATDTVAYGDTPEYTGETPTKARTDKFTYTFDKWSPEVTIVTGDAEYTATFTETINKYTIIWYDEDGTTILDEQEVEYDEMPVYGGQTPSKTATAEFTYTFKEWSPAISTVTGDATYTATYTETINKYVIEFVNEDGTVLQSSEVEYGKLPEYAGETPTKEATAKFTYTFKDWDKEIVIVTGNATYTAQFDSTINKYTITWYDEDGTTILDEQEVEYDAMPVYGGQTPSKAATAEFTYTFKGWNPEVAIVTGDATYTATYSSTVNKYTIKFVNEDGTVLQSSEVEYGKLPEYTGETPTKARTDEFTYVFDKWTPEIASVTGEATYTATFTEVTNTYTITWLDEDGTVLRTDNDVPYGTTLTAPDDPSKAATAEFTYTFAGWNPEVTIVTGDATYTATYSSVKNTYTITFDVEGVITTVTYEYGAMPSYKDGIDPVKEATAQYTYTFAGWDPALTTVTGNATYKAKFNATVNKYTVVWKNDDGSVLETDTEIEYGTMPEYNGLTPTKAADAQYTYEWLGWTPTVSEVTGNVTYTATYTNITNEYTITWIVDGNTTTETYEYGATPSFKGSTDKAEDAQYTYDFTGWDPEIADVTGDATYTAQYSSTLRSYTVTWKNDDGTVLETDENVSYGSTPSYDGNTPEKAATAQYTYTFAGWDPVISNVSGDVTYTATYSSTVNQYLIKFVNEDGTVLQSSLVEYGKMPVYTASTPTKAKDAQYTYEWLGWDPEITSVTGEATYTATFTETVNKYTVTWKNYDGTVLETDENVPYGTDPSYDGNTPEKASDVQYSYTFTGWTPEVSTVTGNVVYTATFESSVNKYLITWLDGDGNVLYSEDLDYGSTPAYSGQIPSKTATAEFTYTFNNKWSPAIAMVTADATYTAQFDSTRNTYTVYWKNHDGTILETDENVPYGSTPSYNGATPTKEKTAQNSYTFAGWDPEVGPIEGNTSYMATFTSSINEYTVTWVVDGNMTTETYKYGDMPSFKGSTDKAQDAQYTYKFTGWTPKVVSVVGDATYTATYDSEVRKYTVTWIVDGSIKEEIYEYGKTPVYPDGTPSKEANAQYTYTFTGWSPSITKVTGDASYTAIFSSTVNKYTITWIVDGTTTYEVYEYGQTPEKDDPYKYHYIFKGWNPEITTVTGNKTYTATFSPIGLFVGDNKDTLYYDNNGTLMDEFTGNFYYDSDLYHNLGDNNYYYVVDGIVQHKPGLYYNLTNNKYYYVGESGCLLVDGKYYITTTSTDYLPTGYYTFNEDGEIYKHDSITNSNDHMVYVIEDYAYIDGIRVAIGLLKYDNHYYYATNEGKIVKATSEEVYVSFYISKNNGYGVEEGLYLFDENGHIFENINGTLVEVNR